MPWCGDTAGHKDPIKTDQLHQSWMGKTSIERWCACAKLQGRLNKVKVLTNWRSRRLIRQPSHEVTYGDVSPSYGNHRYPPPGSLVTSYTPGHMTVNCNTMLHQAEISCKPRTTKDCPPVDLLTFRSIAGRVHHYTAVSQHVRGVMR